jgi:superfamily II DNA helicase RecQ
MEMSRKLPASRDAFIELNGVSIAKWEKYGKVFLTAIAEYTQGS